MRRKARAANLLIATALAGLVAAIAVYGALLYRWLHPKPHAALGMQPARADYRVPEDLADARREFRARYVDPKTHLRLAAALHKAGRGIDAFYVMSAARQFFGDADFNAAHLLVVTHHGSHFLQGRRFDPSPANEALLRERLAKSPADIDAINYLAHLAAAKGDYQGAIGLLDLGLSRRPGDVALMLYRAELFGRSLQDFSSAVTWYGKLAAAAPDSYEGGVALNELGRIAQMRLSGRDAGAPLLSQQLLHELLVKYSESPAVFNAMALSALARNEVESVTGLVADALDRDPGHAGALAMRGALFLHARDPESALSAFSAAWKKNPTDLYTTEKLAQLFLKHKADPEAALPFYLAIYLNSPSWEDGEPVETTIHRILDRRREERLGTVDGPLLERYLREEDASLRAQACEKVAAEEDVRWIEELVRLLDDDTEIVRHNADFALFRLARRHRPALLAKRLQWLEDPSPFTRARALNLFADIDRANTFPVAIRALSDPQPTYRFLAKAMVLDHYYKDAPAAAQAIKDYLVAEKDPYILAYYAKLAAPQ